jgi:beta-lactamase class A
MSRRRTGFPTLAVAALLMILAAVIILVVQLGQFSTARQNMPPGLMMGGVPVGGFSPEAAAAQVEQTYGRPITLKYREEVIMLDPSSIGLRVNSEAMLARADELRTEGTFWSGFWEFIWRRPTEKNDVDLVVEYSEDQLRALLADIAQRYDRPPQPAQPVLNTLSFLPGSPGHTLDVEASVRLIDSALRRPVDRTVDLVVEEGDAPAPDLEALRNLLVTYLAGQQYRGLASVHVIDLQTGDEMALNVDFDRVEPVFYNYDIAYAGMSVMKIPILVEFYRYLDGVPDPASDDAKILKETITLSGNFTANVMLREIGGGDAKRGVETVNQSMQYLGLENTFIAAEYDEEEDPPYISTPARECARSGECINTRPDPYMQTTPRDMAALLDMIYQCAKNGGGGLVAAYPDSFTQQECENMIDLMTQNVEGVLILAGVPEEGTLVAHKHGWVSDTHADAGLVLSPGGDYVLVVFMWDNVDWLDYQVSFPLIAGISQATFNYFNPDLVLEPRRGFSSEEPTTTP